MSEKEFLKSAFEHMWPDAIDFDPAKFDNLVDNFLQYHHQAYYEVEFIRKPENELSSMEVK